MSEAGGTADGVTLSPLLRRDPPRVGSIVLVGRLDSHDAGLTYAGRLEPAASSPSPADESVETGRLVAEESSPGSGITVVMLTAGAETDSYARARFRVAIADLADDQPGAVVGYEDEEDLSPWVAFSTTSWSEGRCIAERLLSAVTLEDQPPIGTVQGPPFRPHWWERVHVGRWRLWPLPWPSSLSAAGRWTFLASFAVICALAALALWIAVLVFQHQPPPAPAPGPGPGPNPPSTSPTPQPTEPGGPSPTPGGPSGSPIPPIV